MANKTELIDELRKNLQKAVDGWSEAVTSWVENAEFENGEQWDASAKVEREGRPCLVINKVSQVVKQITGDQKQQKVAIKVRPVDDTSDPQIAEIYNGLIRNIENISNAAEAYDMGFEQACKAGFGAWRIITKYSTEDAFDQDIAISRIVNPLTVMFDPLAVDKHKRDASWCIVSDWMPKKEFEKQYPKKNTASADVGDIEDSGLWKDDDRVRVVEYWYKKTEKKTLLQLQDGTVVDSSELPEGMYDQMTAQGFITRERDVEYPCVYWCKSNGAEIIEGPTKWAGKHIPIVFVPGEEVWIKGKVTYRCAFEFAKDPQRLYNWARSTAAETLSLAPKQPYLLTPQQIEGHEALWDSVHRVPRPYLLYNEVGGQGTPERQPSGLPDVGAFQEVAASAEDIKSVTGIFDASLGKQSNETSGRAIIARQQQGATATYVYTDNFTSAIKYTGEILVDIIPKIYDTERVVRLLGPQDEDAAVRINQTTVDPLSGKEKTVNDLSAGKYDVAVSTGVAYQTKRLESADAMVQLLQAAPQYAPVVVPRLAKNLDWPEADDIANEMKAMIPTPGDQQDPQAQQAMMQQQEMQQQQFHAAQQAQQMELAKLQLELEGKQISNEAARQKMEIDAAKAQMELRNQAINNIGALSNGRSEREQ